MVSTNHPVRYPSPLCMVWFGDTRPAFYGR